jgi:hypothetical protein
MSSLLMNTNLPSRKLGDYFLLCSCLDGRTALIGVRGSRRDIRTLVPYYGVANDVSIDPR